MVVLRIRGNYDAGKRLLVDNFRLRYLGSGHFRLTRDAVWSETP